MVVDCNINVIVDTMSLLKNNYLPVDQHLLFVDHVNVIVDTMHLLQNNYVSGSTSSVDVDGNVNFSVDTMCLLENNYLPVDQLPL